MPVNVSLADDLPCILQASICVEFALCMRRLSITQKVAAGPCSSHGLRICQVYGVSKLRGPCSGVRLGVVVFWVPGVFFEATIDRSIQDAPL